MKAFREERQRTIKMVLTILGGGVAIGALAFLFFWLSFLATIWVLDADR